MLGFMYLYPCTSVLQAWQDMLNQPVPESTDGPNLSEKGSDWQFFFLSIFVSYLIVHLLSIQSEVPLDNRSTKTDGCQGDRHTLLIKVNFKHTKHFVGRTTLIEFFYLAYI